MTAPAPRPGLGDPSFAPRSFPRTRESRLLSMVAKMDSRVRGNDGVA